MYHEFADLLTIISQEELRQLTDDTNVGSIVENPPNAPMVIINKAGEKAATLIDGYCRGRYAVPLSPIPAMIKDMSAELTVYNCMSRKKEIALSEEQNRRYKNAIMFLEHIQDGKIQLYDSVKSPPCISTNKTIDDRTFSDDVLETF